MRLNKKHIFVTIAICTLVICAVCFCLLPKTTLALNGQSKEVVTLNSTYVELGTNIKDVQIDGVVDTSKVGTYKIKYTYKDQTVVRNVVVEDNKQLVMNLNGSKDTVCKKGENYIESGCHVIDKKYGDLTSSVKISGNVDTSKAGDYKITYTVTNKDGVTSNQVRNVKVVDELKGNTKGVPVLMYHYVYTDNDVPKKLNVNYIKDKDLEAQLKYLIQNNYYFPSYKELEAYTNGQITLPEKSVVLTFDDGQIGFLKYGIPLLEKYKVPATSFVIASKDGEQKVKEYASEYISFQSHSYNMHRAGGNIGHGGVISAMKKDEIVTDLKKAQVVVQNSEALAYPYGDITEDAKKAVKETGILCAFTTQYGRIKKGTDLTCAPRVRVSGGHTLKAYIAAIE
ncbi:MAG: DUF5011 domain-containing protein [Coprobacillus sp.]